MDAGTGIGLGILGSSLFDYFSGKEQSDAGVKAQEATIAAQKESQDKAIGLQQFTDPFGAGRWEGDQWIGSAPGGEDAAVARGKRAFGDIDRARRQNEAVENFGFTIPTLQDARGMVERDRQLNQGNFKSGLERVLMERARKGGGIQPKGGGGPWEQGTVRTIGDYVDQTKVGGEVAATELFQKGQLADLQNLQKAMEAYGAQEAAPPYTTGGPGAVAAQAVQQIPIPGQPIDLSSAVFPTAASNAARNYTNYLMADQQNRDWMNFYERIRPD